MLPYKPFEGLGAAKADWLAIPTSACALKVLRNISLTMASVWMETRAPATECGVTTRTLYRFINEGELPAYRFGRVLRLRKTDIDEFVESKRVAPGSLGHLVNTTR